MKNALITFLVFSIAISGLSQISKPLSQYGLTNHLADGDLIGVSVRPFSAKEATKGITKANLIADLALNPTNGVNSTQASNIVNQILVSSNFVALAKLIATTNGLQAEVSNLQAATNAHFTRIGNVEGGTNGLRTDVVNLQAATNQFGSTNLTPKILFASATPIVGAGTSATNLASVTVAANQLTNNLSMLELELSGTFSLTGQSKQLQVVYGSTTLLDSGSQAVSNCAWCITGTIKRTGNTSQYSRLHLTWGPSSFTLTNSHVFAAETNGVATVLKVVGTSGVTSSITNESYSVRYWPAGW